MKYLNIVVEGQTEETFVNNLLVPYFSKKGLYIYPRQIKTGYDKINNKAAKGGLIDYRAFKWDLMKWIKQCNGNKDYWFSSFIDLYAFPKQDSPYSQEIEAIIDPYNKIAALETAIASDINYPQFIPYVQLHEFEAFVLIEPNRLLTSFPDKKKEIDKIIRSIKGRNPEEINESPDTAPSKRIIQEIKSYKKLKATVGPMIAQDLGLDRLRQNCPHFAEWIKKLENLCP